MVAGPIRCDEFETRFETKGDLMTHIELEHGFDLGCENCDFKKNEITKIINHEGTEHGQKLEQ